jgi:hypothetical protein
MDKAVSYFARTRVTQDVLTRIGARKPSESGADFEFALAGSMVDAVERVLGAVSDGRFVARAAGDIVCRMGVRAATAFCLTGDV